MSKIDVILPVYNGIKYLKDNISSVLSQTLTDFNFVIVDDQSTDGSWEYLQTIRDKRIQLVRNQSNMGLFYNLNYMIKNSNSPLIKLWAQDDIMYHNCLEEIYKFHERFPNIGFSYSMVDYIDETGNLDDKIRKTIDNTPEIVSTQLHTRIAFFVGSIAGNIGNVTLNRKAINEVGLFNEKMKISGDFEMWVRLARDNEIGFLKKSILQLRNHTGQLSRQEQYYIYHIREDIEVYNYLISYTKPSELADGRYLLRNYKLLFYYTLMVKALIKGRFNVFNQFLSILYKFDNIFLLSFFFIKNRILFKKKNDFYQLDNSEFYSFYQRSL